jgi:hypothetical protein
MRRAAEATTPGRLRRRAALAAGAAGVWANRLMMVLQRPLAMALALTLPMAADAASVQYMSATAAGVSSSGYSATTAARVAAPTPRAAPALAFLVFLVTAETAALCARAVARSDPPA